MTAIYLPGQMELPETLHSDDTREYLAARIKRPIIPMKEQKPCDIGLFSDAADQTDLIEMLMNPHE